MLLLDQVRSLAAKLKSSTVYQQASKLAGNLPKVTLPTTTIQQFLPQYKNTYSQLKPQVTNFIKSQVVPNIPYSQPQQALWKPQLTQVAKTAGNLIKNQAVQSYKDWTQPATQMPTETRNAYLNRMTNQAVTMGGMVGNIEKAGVSQLRNLLTYQDKLRAVGFQDWQIGKISASEAQKIFDEGVAPWAHSSFGGSYKGKPRIDFDIQPSEAQTAADKLSIYQADKGTGGLLNRAKGLPQEVRNIFSDWVNARRATDIQGVKAKMPFNQLDKEGLDTFLKTQSGTKGGSFDQLRSFFDTRFQAVRDSGVDLGYKRDYLPQLWKNPKQEVEQALGKTLTQKPSFSLESVIKDYRTGIEKGLTPRFTKVSDLVGWYESYSQKTIADRRFFDQLSKTKLIMPATKAPRDWVSLTDRFPQFKITFPTGEKYMGSYKAPETVAKIINNYLEPGSEVLTKAAGFTTKIKNVALSSGIPTTSINAHGFNLGTRYILANNNPVKGMWHALEWTLAPNRAAKFVNSQLDNAEFFTKAGLSLSTEDQAYTRMSKELGQGLLKKGYNKLVDVQEKLFEDPLFRKTASAYKLDYANQVYQGFKKSGMAEKEAAKEASRVANNIFGGINIEELGRDRNTQNIFRSLILAPDWAETTIRTGKGIIEATANPKNWFNPKYAPYRVFARNLMLALTATNVANKAMSGHWQFQNEPGHEMELDTGTYTYDGKKRYVRPFQTAIDFIRLPVDIASGIAKGDLRPIARVVSNRLSMPAGSLLHVATNTDYLGRPIFGNDKYGNPIPVKQQAGSIANELASFVGVPQYIRAGVDVASGKSNVEQGVTQALELPFRYTGGTYSKAQQQAVELSGNPTHKALWELNNAAKGQSILGKNQAADIQAGKGTVQDVWNKRQITSQKDQIAAELTQAIITGNSDQRIKSAAQLHAAGLSPKSQANLMVKQVNLIQDPVERQKAFAKILPYLKAAKLTPKEMKAAMATP